MTEKEINDFLVKATAIPFEELKELLVLGIMKTIPKKELLAEPGKKIEQSYFLVEGIVRHFVKGKDEEEFTKHMMSSPNFVVASISDFFFRTPASICCEALTDLVVIEWTYEDLLRYANKQPRFYHFLLKCVVNLYKEKEDKEIALHLYDAKTRYQMFIEKYPDIAYDVPLRYIASFLNIRPETLSRIRALK